MPEETYSNNMKLTGTQSFLPALAAVALAFSGLDASAQQDRTSFVYDVNYQYYFDNREFTTGGDAYTTSRTINASRLTPSVGFSFLQNRQTSHRVMAGVDVFKDMGASPVGEDDNGLNNKDLFKEMILWYDISVSDPHNQFRGYAGMFPRRFSVFGSFDSGSSSIPGRDVPSVHLSDEYRFYDSNMEGILLTDTRRHAYYELGLDWLGMQGSGRREQFIITTYGKGALNDWIAAGWTGTFHHYANSFECIGVVDDNLLTPFVVFDLSSLWGLRLQELSLTAAWTEGVHQDRKRKTGLETTSGGLLSFDVRNWSLGLHADCYEGTSQMPYYNVFAPEGIPYASNLYRGDPFFRPNPFEGDFKSIGNYTRCELYWQPEIASFLDLKISFVTHFAAGSFQGWRQKMSLVFDLEKARQSKTTRRRNPRQEHGLFELFL